MSTLTIVSPQEMATTALVLNLVVSGIAFFNYAQAGFFRLGLTWPFLILSIPLAFLGGLMPLKDSHYYALLALVLAFVAIRLIVPSTLSVIDTDTKAPSKPLALGAGAAIGLLSGMIGIGGGIFLSPLMVMCRWAKTKEISATAACFILVNSIAGLAGRQVQHYVAMSDILFYLLPALLGGIIGSYFGARKLPSPRLKQLLGLVLLIAVAKMLTRVF
jgi:uncharacterized membrane protein YfcA